MSREPDDPAGPDEQSGSGEARPPRPSRRDLDAIFGDVLPGTTSDEREPERPDPDRDSWYERNRPPHHDRD
jgi:hypothetical protein